MLIYNYLDAFLYMPINLFHNCHDELAKGVRLNLSPEMTASSWHARARQDCLKAHEVTEGMFGVADDVDGSRRRDRDTTS